MDYINHVGAVTMELIGAFVQGGNYDHNLAVQCALLHDVSDDAQYIKPLR